MAWWVGHLTPGFGSGQDLMVPKTELCVGLCADSAEPAWDSLSPSLSAPPQLVLVHMRMLALSLSQNR